MLSRKVRATRSSSLCFAHLARITRCKFLQPLRYLCQFMYLTTVKCRIRNSFDLHYLRKMCASWVQAARNGPSPPPTSAGGPVAEAEISTAGRLGTKGGVEPGRASAGEGRELLTPWVDERVRSLSHRGAV